MTTTIPMKFVGTPTLTSGKVDIIKEWYSNTLGQSNEATEFIDSTMFKAISNSLEDTLDLLYDERTYTPEVVDVIKKDLIVKDALIVIGVGISIYALWNFDKIKTRLTSKNEKTRTKAREDIRNKEHLIGK